MRISRFAAHFKASQCGCKCAVALIGSFSVMPKRQSKSAHALFLGGRLHKCAVADLVRRFSVMFKCAHCGNASAYFGNERD